MSRYCKHGNIEDMCLIGKCGEGNEEPQNTCFFGDWIKCSQSLPKDQESVLVVSKHGKKVVMYRERGVWVEGLVTAHWEPTHWATLPSSPKK